MKEGKNFFEKVLTVSTLPPYSQMTLPASFVQDYDDKIQQFVTLRNIENKKTWTVKINVYLPQNRPQAIFCRGWRTFTSGNDLVIGDRLTFVLVAPSLFDIFILRNIQTPVLSMKMPKMRAQHPSVTRRKTRKTLGLQHDGDLLANSSENSNYTRNGRRLAKEEIGEQKFVAHAPGSSHSLSNVASHFIEPFGEQREAQRVSKAVKKETAFEAQDQSTLPCFHKQVTVCNNLEIPCSFVKMHHTQLVTSVKLQGVHERSPVCTVDCKSFEDRGRLRIYFRTGWPEFVKDNFLRVGQGLVFTLTANSSFIVRKM